MDTFSYRGWSIAFAHAGRGAPVVLLHNGGTSHAIWREVVPKLAERHEVFALDLLGYGASSKPGSGYTMDAYVDILGAFIDEKRLSPIALVGNCMGSAISLTFAMRRPRDARALVLVNPLTEATLLAGGIGPALRLKRIAPAVSEAIHGHLSRTPLPHWVGDQVFRFQLGRRGRSHGVAHREELCACFSTPTQVASMVAVLDDIASYAALDRFTPPAGFPPITTVWGLDNRVLSTRAGRKLNATLRPVREAWIERAGHLPMLEAPYEVARIVLGALDAAAARAEVA
jgi:pimeloyl-ACP methyl ester carboxylesterase